MFIVILNYYHLSGELNSKIIGTYGSLTTRKIEEDVKQFINENLFDDDNNFYDYVFQLVGHYLPTKKLVNVEKTTDLTSGLWDLCKKEDDTDSDNESNTDED
jgi:hypothetical protein